VEEESESSSFALVQFYEAVNRFKMLSKWEIPLNADLVYQVIYVTLFASFSLSLTHSRSIVLILDC